VSAAEKTGRAEVGPLVPLDSPKAKRANDLPLAFVEAEQRREENRETRVTLKPAQVRGTHRLRNRNIDLACLRIVTGLKLYTEA
jgi:hypothetical protein